MQKLFFSSVAIAGLLFCGGIVAAQQASAQTTTTSTTPASAAAASSAGQDANDPDRIVCKTGPAPTGSRLGATHECHTQREWDLRMQEQQQALTRQQIDRGCLASGCH